MKIEIELTDDEATLLQSGWPLKDSTPQEQVTCAACVLLRRAIMDHASHISLSDTLNVVKPWKDHPRYLPTVEAAKRYVCTLPVGPCYTPTNPDSAQTP